jgi:hypothetical protein
VARDVTGANGDDCAARAGHYLSVLADWHDATSSPEAAEQGHRVFQGAWSLYAAGPRPGFIVRGLHPDDPDSYPLNTSVDQYTWYVYGLWKWYHSHACTAEEEAGIQQILHDVCTLIEAEGFDIRDAHGAPTQGCDIGVIRSDRSSRLLAIYRVGHDVTGDDRWRGIYHEKLRENGWARLRSLLDPEQVAWPYGRGLGRQGAESLHATQVSLVTLFELERDPPVKAAYLEALRVHARLAEEAEGPHAAAGLAAQLLAHARAVVAASPGPAEARDAQRLSGALTAVVEAASPFDLTALGAWWTAVRRGVVSGE